MSRRCLVRALVGIGLAVLLASCAIGPESEPEAVAVTIEPGTSARAEATGSGDHVVYLIDADGDLVESPRDLSAPVDIRQLLTSLLAGPTASEVDRGLSTAIPSSTVLSKADLVDDTLELDLRGDFAAAGGDREIAAIAQIVLTVTQLQDVDFVTFSLSGTRVAVPRGNGALTRDAVGHDDYLDLLAG